MVKKRTEPAYSSPSIFFAISLSAWGVWCLVWVGCMDTLGRLWCCILVRCTNISSQTNRTQEIVVWWQHCFQKVCNCHTTTYVPLYFYFSFLPACFCDFSQQRKTWEPNHSNTKPWQICCDIWLPLWPHNTRYTLIVSKFGKSEHILFCFYKLIISIKGDPPSPSDTQFGHDSPLWLINKTIFSLANIVRDDPLSCDFILCTGIVLMCVIK